MNSIILIGSKSNADIYIEQFVTHHAIKPYYIDRFSETLKISQVRELKKKLSIKLEASQSRLFIIEAPVTTEAQNALLKTFEESASWVYFILCQSSPHNLLPTILSRCQLIFLEPQEEEQNVDKQFEVFGRTSYELLYSVFEKFHFFVTLQDLESFISAFRIYIKNAISHQQTLSPLLIHRYIKICEQYSLIKSNNINRKTAIETAIISEKK